MITGRVTDRLNETPIGGAVVWVGGGQQGGRTDANGRYAIRDVLPGVYRVTVRAVGFRAITRDSVFVSSGRTVVLDFVLTSEAVALPGVAVVGTPDRLLDPREPQTIQQIGGEELRQLPVTSLEEAIELQAGVVQGSFRGGRVGEEAWVIDGLGVKNQLDASSGQLGLRIPTVALEEATLVTNAFSARYGQALSGLVTAATRDGGERWEGRIAYETDRPLPDGWDVGLDRLTVSVGGPVLGSVRLFAALDAQGRIDDGPVHAPPPEDTLDPRTERPWLLPHNSGEQYDLFGKLTIPLGRQQTLRLSGASSESRRLLYDPALKYVPDAGPAQRVSGRLGLLHFRRTSSPSAATSFIVDLRLGYFSKEAIRAPLTEPTTAEFGAFTFAGLEFAGEALAKAGDTLGALDPIPGVTVPQFVETTPWGVPGFFTTASPRGELTWNRFREGRARLDFLVGRGADTDLRLGGEYVRQQVTTFTRLEGYRAVVDGAPPPTTAAFSPFQAAGYVELQQRAGELTLTGGLRADAFNGRAVTEGGQSKTQFTLGPRLALSTALGPATIVASWGRFAQPPDFQYLVDAAFDDTLRTGRFRRGNPSLGFETSTQYEFQVRARPVPFFAVRVGAFVKRLDGLVASIPLGFDPDSSIYGNGDFGNVKGLEVTLEREYRDAFGLRATYVLQQAEATATDARDLFRRLQITPVGDTVVPATAEFPLNFDRRHAVIVVARASVPVELGSVVGGTEAALVARWSSGLPFSRSNATGDSLIGLPNAQRLPAQVAIDLFLRRTVRIGGMRLGGFVDVRNLTNRRNVVAVRRDNGQPVADDLVISTAAEAAFQANPDPIPYESRRYRPWADLDANGLVEGRDELLPLYLRAATDFTQPLFFFGSPRLVRLGVELRF
jgi:hypothetical protein